MFQRPGQARDPRARERSHGVPLEAGRAVPAGAARTCANRVRGLGDSLARFSCDFERRVVQEETTAARAPLLHRSRRKALRFQGVIVFKFDLKVFTQVTKIVMHPSFVGTEAARIAPMVQ